MKAGSSAVQKVDSKVDQSVDQSVDLMVVELVDL